MLRDVDRIPKLELRPRRATPAMVPIACAIQAEEKSGVTAASLIAELKKNNAKREELRVAEETLEAERAAFAEVKDRLTAERLELDLLRAELEGGPPVNRKPDESAPTLGEATGNDPEEVKKLSATVRAMKADKAAAALALLDQTLASEVMRTLSKPAAAAIFDRLAPEVAAGIMRNLVQAATVESAP